MGHVIFKNNSGSKVLVSHSLTGTHHSQQFYLKHGEEATINVYFEEGKKFYLEAGKVKEKEEVK